MSDEPMMKDKACCEKVCMISLGCPKNLVNSEKILGTLAQEGKQFVATPEEADTVIVNTCCFIDSATQESVDTIKEMSEKCKGTDKKLVVTGCLTERFGNEVLDVFPEVSEIIGLSDPAAYVPRLLSTPMGTAYLRIAEGCDNRCSFCIIPAIKGPYRSFPHEEIIAEAKILANQGVRELLVIAQDTTAYNDNGYLLPDLLRDLCVVEGIEWVRVHYCYPERVSDELIAKMKNETKICKYIDIPIQHCNDDILRRMGRTTTKSQIVELIGKLRREIPEICIRTSLIVGFPGETQEQFEELVDFVQEIKFDRLGVFEFSPQEGTTAAEMPDQVSEDVKKQRFETLMEKQAEIVDRLNEKKIGQVVQVIVESAADGGGVIARTQSDSLDIDGLVHIHDAKGLLPGDMVCVEITAATDYDLVGELI